jgi:stress response protein YsnF
METSTFGPITDWNEVIKKEVKGLNDADFGEVQEVNENYVLTQRGTLNKEKFYLPKSIPHGYNGRILLFDITEEEAKKRFVIDKSTSSASEGKEKEFQIQDNERPIPVIEERLEISKKETIVEAKVIKKPVKETKSVEVELTHEELIIEKRPIDDNTSSTTTSTSTASQSATQSSPSPSKEMTQSKIEISIPLKKEDVVVSKKSFVKEEIIIKKKPVTETKTITEQIISEKVSVINADGEEVIEEVGSEK